MSNDRELVGKELGRTTSDEFIEERKGVNCVEVSRCCGEVR